MKILLLGGTGQLGQEIIRLNNLASHPVDLITLKRNDLDLQMPSIIQQKLEQINFEILINCTAYNEVDAAEKNTNVAFDVNAYGVHQLAKSCRKKGARLIHFSTDYVFGGGIKHTKPIHETAKPAPVNIYGSSKFMGESLARSSLSDVTILRVASLFGVGGLISNRSNFVETIIRLGTKGQKFNVVMDQTVSPTSTFDVATAILRILRERISLDLLHIVNTGSVTRFDFACEILRQARLPALAIPISSVKNPTPAIRPSYSVLDNSKSRSYFTIPPWQDALERYLYERKIAQN